MRAQFTQGCHFSDQPFAVGLIGCGQLANAGSLDNPPGPLNHRC